MSRTPLLIIAFLLLIVLILSGCTHQSDLPATIWQISPLGTVEVPLFPGDQAYQDGDMFLLMSSYTLERPPTQMMAFSMSKRAEIWRVDLPAPPVQAIRFGSLYLVATIPSESSGQAYVIAMDAGTGKAQWTRSWGKAMIALSSDGEHVWVAWEQGVNAIDPTTGETLFTVVTWEHPERYGSQRALALWRGQEQMRLAVSAGRTVFFYEGKGSDWKPLMSFQSAGRVLEIHAMDGESEPAWLILAHSCAYGLAADGRILWRVNNSDYNLDGQLVYCEGKNLWAFRNVMGKLYLVNSNTVVRSWQLPGGFAHAGPIPLPFPEHLAFGLQASDLNEDGEDELIIRSLQRLFVFDCRANLLALAPVDTDDEKLVQSLRQTRLHRPAVMRRTIITPAKKGILYLDIYN